MTQSSSRISPKLAAALAAALAVWALLAWFILGPSLFTPASALTLLALVVLVSGALWWVRRVNRAALKRARSEVQRLATSPPGERLYVEDVASDEGRLGLSLNALLDRWEDSLARQRQFVSAVSHDIRTPLTIIKGDIEVALMRRRNPEEYEEILSSNLEEVERIHHLVDDLVTLARADYGEMGLNVRTVTLAPLVAEVREGFNDAARRKELILETYLEGDVQIEGDRTRLRQLFYNLIDNAIHYTPNGGRIEVTLTGALDRDEAQVRIRDTGVGIAPRDLPHIFEAFYRGTPSRRTRHNGYGLGLSICDHIVRAHGGRISVESRQGPGSGTTFLVHLPRRARPQG